MTVTAITSKAQFDEIIKKDIPVFIDFWATWCGPCRQISPFFEKLAGEVEGAEFYKVDVDDQPEIAEEVAIRAMPTFVAFKGGKKVGDFVGAVRPKLEELVKNNL